MYNRICAILKFYTLSLCAYILIKDYTFLPLTGVVKYVIVIKDIRQPTASSRIDSIVCCKFMI